MSFLDRIDAAPAGQKWAVARGFIKTAPIDDTLLLSFVLGAVPDGVADPGRDGAAVPDVQGQAPRTSTGYYSGPICCAPTMRHHRSTSFGPLGRRRNSRG